MEKVVFLDRDGVINRRMPEHEHVLNWGSFEFLPAVEEGIRILNEEGYVVVVITNQSCIARGQLTEAALNLIHEKMNQALIKNNAIISKIIYCPHDDNQCSCRKPAVGMFLEFEKEMRVDKLNSYMIGDSVSDIKAGTNYGVRTIFIGEMEVQCTYKCKSLRDAVKYITGR